MKCTNNVSLSTFDYLHPGSLSEGSTISELCCSQMYIDYGRLLILWQLSHLANNEKKIKKTRKKRIKKEKDTKCITENYQ